MKEHKDYRKAVGIAQYVCADRPDIQRAVKELSRKLTKPTQWDAHRVTRLARYLHGTRSRCAKPPSHEEHRCLLRLGLGRRRQDKKVDQWGLRDDQFQEFLQLDQQLEQTADGCGTQQR